MNPIIASIDLTAVGTQVVSGVLAISAVATFVAKYVSRARKYAHLAKTSIITLSDAVDALEDGKLSPEEVARLQNDVASFKAELNTAQPSSAIPVK